MTSRFLTFARSSIGKKMFMSLSGILLILFLVAHVAGNLTLFADDTGATFAKYAHTLRTNPLLPVAELGLAALFVAHIGLGLRTALENRQARPNRYKRLESHGNRTWSSVTMVVTGTMVLVFLVIHLLDFRLAADPEDDLGPMVVARLSSPIGAAIYFVGVGALGVHLWHAFQSLFQTLGIHHPRYRPLIQRVGYGVAGVFALLFWLFPTFCMLQPDRWSFASETAREAPLDPGQPGRPAARDAVRDEGGAR